MECLEFIVSHISIFSVKQEKDYCKFFLPHFWYPQFVFPALSPVSCYPRFWSFWITWRLVAPPKIKLSASWLSQTFSFVTVLLDRAQGWFLACGGYWWLSLRFLRRRTYLSPLCYLFGMWCFWNHWAVFWGICSPGSHNWVVGMSCVCGKYWCLNWLVLLTSAVNCWANFQIPHCKCCVVWDVCVCLCVCMCTHICVVWKGEIFVIWKWLEKEWIAENLAKKTLLPNLGKMNFRNKLDRSWKEGGWEEGERKREWEREREEDRE